jgi:hypothetical protein
MPLFVINLPLFPPPGVQRYSDRAFGWGLPCPVHQGIAGATDDFMHRSAKEGKGRPVNTDNPVFPVQHYDQIR